MITTVQSAVKIVIQQHEQAVQKKQEEQAAFTPYWKFPIFDDDDDEYTIQYKEYLENSSNAITPDLSTEEPDNSLSMGDEHLDTIPETESDEVIKSSVEDLVPIPSESEGIFDNMCDVPFCDKNHFYAEYDLLESLLNRDTSIVYSPKIDSLLEEFAGELAPINPIPSGIHEADFDPEEDIRLDDQMFYDDTSSDDDSFEDIDYVEASPPDSELVSLEEVKDDILREKLLNIYLLIAKIESLNDNPTPDCVLKSPSLFPIPVEDSDSFFETESGEVIKSSVEDLVPIPSEFEGIFNNMCDVPFCDKNHFDAESDLLESLPNRDTSIVYSSKIDSLLEEFAGELAPINLIPLGIHEADFDPEEDIRLIEQFLYDDYALSDDDPLYSEDIDYVEASPPDSELINLEEVKDDILREKLLNIYLLIAKIESLNHNPNPNYVLKSPSPFPIPVEDSDSFFKKSDTSLSYSDNSLLEFETFSNHTEETSSGSTTTHADNSLPEYDSFLFETEPDQGELTSVVMKDILGEPRVPNVFPTHPTLYLDLDFALFDDSLKPDLVVSL
ncbi:hypothetical protein Tco_0416988 [Tanacetum coccineum]